MKMAAGSIRGLIPTITDSIVLSFAFFLLSDIHQILSNPTLGNFVRVLTSLQISSGSPFDYPAFFFLGLVLVNFVSILASASFLRPEPSIDTTFIPLQRCEPTVAAAQNDCLSLAAELRSRAKAIGIEGEISMKTIGSIPGRRRLTQNELRILAASAREICGKPSCDEPALSSSPLTSALLRVSLRLGTPIGGMYHPLQRKISLNPNLPCTVAAYVYAHEMFHSLQLGEVGAEIATIQACMKLGNLNGMPLDFLGLYLLFRACATYLIDNRAIEEIRPQLNGIRYGRARSFTVLLAWRRSRLEKEIYVRLKGRPK